MSEAEISASRGERVKTVGCDELSKTKVAQYERWKFSWHTSLGLKQFRIATQGPKAYI